MNAFLSYLIQVSILTALFITLYIIVFRPLKYFKVNRVYLLSILLLSTLLPLLNVPLPQGSEVPVINFDEIVIPTPEVMPQNTTSSEVPSYTSMPESKSDFQFPWMLIYWIGVVLLLSQSIWILIKIIKLRYKLPSEFKSGFRQISTDGVSAFSFFNWIFLDKKKLGEQDHTMILTHELAHSKQLHSLDLLFIQTIQVFLWFNPFIILVKKALKENHEFLADEEVLRSGVPLSTYADSLKMQIFSRKSLRIASYFRGSTLKKRMVMATRPSTSSKWKYLAILPFLALAFALFSFGSDPINEPLVGISPKKFTVVIDPGHGGKDPGVLSGNGWEEKDVVLDLAKMVKKYSDRSVQVILLRTKDEYISTYDRIKMIKAIEPDLFISLHMTTSSGGLSDGWSVYYSPFYDWAYQSAQVADWIAEVFSIRDNPPRFGPEQSPVKILQETYCPAILLDLAYMDNYYDKLTYTQPKNWEKVAKDLASTILEVKNRIEVSLPKRDIGAYKAQTHRPNGYISPITPENITRIASYFHKSKFHPILKVHRPHTGVDITAPRGTPIIATDIGTVIKISNSIKRSGYGKSVLIEHNNEIHSFYAHLDEINVAEGDRVYRGQTIGKVGNTGLSMTPHLHFEIRKDGKPTAIVNGLMKGTMERFQESKLKL